NDYLKISLDELVWIEAAGSYSILHLLGGKSMTLSFNLAVIEKKLPQTEFMRIHRSYIVNLQHITSLIGNSLKLGTQLLIIGREYRDKLLDRFVFLGVRRNKSK
ncbi:MAG: LytTR family DNA-binding domain-containing protein, partial [Mucinivorans sp.]